MTKYKAKASKGAVAFVGIMAFIAVLGVLAIALGLASNWSYWIPKKYLPGGNGGKDDVVAVAPAANMTIQQTDNSGIMLLSAPMALSDFEVYDVSPLADNVQTLTATLSPADTTLKKVDYTGKWANPNSTWAKGKEFSDYVQLTQSEDGALTCAVSALQPFGEPGVITCTARALNEGDWVPSATCSVNYYQRITDCTVRFIGTFTTDDEEQGEFTTTDYEYNLGVSTVKYVDEYVTLSNGVSSVSNTCTATSTVGIGTIRDGANNNTLNITVRISDSVAAKIKSAAGVSTLKTYTLVSNGVSNGFKMKTALDTILGGSSNVNSHKNAIYSAFKEIYDKGQSALTFEISFNSTYEKFEHTFTKDSLFNPLALGVKTSDVNLDKDNITL